LGLAKHNKSSTDTGAAPRGDVANETADQLAKLGTECPLTGPEPASGISVGVAKKATETIKTLGVLNRTPTGKGTRTRSLWQKNHGTVKTIQKPVTVDDRTTYRTVSPTRTPFQNTVDR
jgi:hypothetical protein